MSTINNEILIHMDDPKTLEKIYRHDEQRFRVMFVDAYQMRPDALVLKVWNERLKECEPSKLHFFDRSFIVMAILALVSALVMRLIFFLVDDQIIAPINFLFALFPFMCLYWILTQTISKRLTWIFVGMLLGLIIYFNFLPSDISDVVLLTYLHLPIVLWLVWGMSHAGDSFREVSSRMSFLKFNGEFLVLYLLFALAGVALTGITLMLFGLLDIDIAEFYFENVVVMGIAGLAIVANHVLRRFGKITQSIAPLLAKIFSPLLLLTLITYLIAMLVLGKNPFVDRDFLIHFNVILVLVLAITIYLITERGVNQSTQFMDALNLVLIACALLINVVALIAMTFRLSSYGITPNRLTSFVLNILIMLHLLRIGGASLKFIQRKGTFASVQAAVTSWFPVYGIWALIVIVVFPIIF